MDALISDELHEQWRHPKHQIPPLRSLRYAPVGMTEFAGNGAPD
jgi:hypothetical protein